MPTDGTALGGGPGQATTRTTPASTGRPDGRPLAPVSFGEQRGASAIVNSGHLRRTSAAGLICALALFLFGALPGRAAAPPESAPVRIELLAPEVKGAIPAGPGSHDVEDPLRFRVHAEQGGWTMKLKSSKLALETGEHNTDGEPPVIEPGEVCLVTGTDPDRITTAAVRRQSLDIPRTVVDRGTPGADDVSLRLGLDTTGSRTPGWYAGHLLIGTHLPGGRRAPLCRVRIRVRVGCRAKHTIKDSKIYFHYGRPGEKQVARIKGSVETDARMQLVLSTDAGRVDALPLQRAFGRADRPDAAIPVTWRLRDGRGGGRAPDSTSRDADRVSWIIRGTPGKVRYEIECEIRPESYQAPGDYGMRVDLTLVPLL